MQDSLLKHKLNMAMEEMAKHEDSDSVVASRVTIACMAILRRHFKDALLADDLMVPGVSTWTGG